MNVEDFRRQYTLNVKVMWIKKEYESEKYVFTFSAQNKLPYNTYKLWLTILNCTYGVMSLYVCLYLHMNSALEL
jgi:hypothetical protein